MIPNEREEVDMAKHTLHILDHTGHTTITYDPALEAEVEEAFAAFKTAQGNRYLAYAEGEGREREVVREFDPTAERTTMRPQMQGG